MFKLKENSSNEVFHNEILEKFDWLEERTILLSKTGSHAYGTNMDDSDVDYKGVCIPPINYFLGLNVFNEYNNSGGKNFKNTKDDKDISIIHIVKFVKDALKGVPNNIEILFTREEDIVKKTHLGQMLIDNRHLFLSKQIKQKFGGYAKSEKSKLINNRRGELVEKYGYDTKRFMHNVRLLTSAIEILKEGDFQTYRPNRDFLLDCRNGKYTLEEALEIIDYYENKLIEAYEITELPDKPPYEKINKLLIEINKQALFL